MRSRLWSLLLVPLLLGAGQPIDPQHLAWDASGGPDLVAGYEVVQGWDGAEIGSTVTGLTVPLPARTGTAYAARVRALPVDAGTNPSNWATLAAEWPDVLPQITSLSQLGRTTAPLPVEGTVMADPTFGELGTLVYKGAVSASSMASTITNVAVGDLLIAAAKREYQDNITGVASTSPALTFTKIAGGRSATAAEGGTDLWAAIATSAASSMVITATYSDSQKFGGLVTARYTPGVTSITASATAAHTTLQASSTNRTITNISPAVRTLMIVVGENWDYFYNTAPATNWTERVDSDTFGNDTTTQFLFDRIADAGTYPSGNFATNATADQYLALIAAFPVSATSVVPVLMRQYAARRQ